MPKRHKPSRVVLDSINGRGTTPENDLVLMNPEGPQSGKDILPLSFAAKCSVAERSPECLLRGHHKAVDAHCLPQCLGRMGQSKNRCWQFSTAMAHSRHSAGASGTMRCSWDLVIRRCCSKSQANTLIFRGIEGVQT